MLLLKYTFYIAESWTLRKLDQKYLENFKVWFWRRTEKIHGTIRVRKEVIFGVKEERNILRTTKRKNVHCTGYI
jgi:hypothetical protein